MILLCFALTFCYVSTFKEYWEEQEEQILSLDHRQRLTFLFFWSGFYCDYGGLNYLEVAGPYYILLIIVILERLA